MYKVILKKDEEKRILNGHLWIYANEVSKISGSGTQGSICEVTSFNGQVLGYGYINHASKIIVRIISKTYLEMDEDFFIERIEKAKQYKEELGYFDNYRVIFSESDGLPGLVVDKYGEFLSIQILTLGMDKCRDLIVNALVKIFNPKGIYERSDVSIRQKEGLKEVKGLLYGEVSEETIIVENGLKMSVDVINGQKTGYFLDQKENRENVKKYVSGKTVLDCFCNVGGFGLNALSGGASHVTFLDISARAIEEVKKNANLNEFSNYSTYCVDCFKALRDYISNGTKFDCVILDPPAFIKTIDSVKNGYRGYVDINVDALKIVNKGGYLITFSCSEHLTPNLFQRMIEEAVLKSKVNAKLIEMRYQARDHASLINMQESLYLKCAIIQVV